jgi:hypothetical protein
MWGGLSGPKTIEMTANDNIVYDFTWLDPRKGALVLEMPPMFLGAIDDAAPLSCLVEGQPRGHAIDVSMQVVESLKLRLALPELEVQWVKLQAAGRVPAAKS